MQMLEPDFWKGKGRYSKKATSRKVSDKTPYVPQSEQEVEAGEDGGDG